MNRRMFCRSALATATAAAIAPLQQVWASPLQSVNSAVDARTLTGQQSTLSQIQVRELAESLHGSLLLPGNAQYDLARQVLNPVIDKHPALVVQPSGVSDVMNAVQFASDNQLEVAVKCGGHSTAGKSTTDGGMQIDLSHFRHVRVDPTAQLAHVSGGSLLAPIDHEAMNHNLVTVAGTVSHTGVGGLATGGGFGRLARRFGLALDNIHAVEVVSADGKVRRASAQENQDLYWGVRGGGSNFGVVTAFEFNLHPMNRNVFAGRFVYPMSRFRDVLEFYAEFSARAPNELQADLIAGYPPGGRPGFVMLGLCYSGSQHDGEKAIASIKSLGKPMAGGMRMVDYVALQRSADNTAPRSTASYLKGGFLSSINPQLIDSLVEVLEPHPDRSAQFIFQQAGGAISDIAIDATAFPHRYAELNMMLSIGWKPEVEGAEHVRFIKRKWATLQPFTHGFYANEAADDNMHLFNKNYQGNYARLLDIKKHYDPQNIFRLNANIQAPSAA